MEKLLKILIYTSLVFVMSCADTDDDDNFEPPPVETPNETPTTVREWTRIRTHHRSDMVVEGQCEFPWILNIRKSGSFNGGPCHGEPIVGHLTQSERSELNRRASDVAGDIDNRDCQQVLPIVESYHQITVTGEGTRRFYDADIEEARVCYRGGVGDANRLKDYLVDTILMKYYRPAPDDLR